MIRCLDQARDASLLVSADKVKATMIKRAWLEARCKTFATATIKGIFIREQ